MSEFNFGELKPRAFSTPLVSVVIPCYNVEEYIDQCLNSVLNNGYPSIEVICVDDHSTDNTIGHIQEIQKTHPNVKLILNTQANIYGGACRNLGMKDANGKYLYFCDSDDYVLPGLFTECVRRAESLNAEVVAFKAKTYRVNQSQWTGEYGIFFDYLLDKSKSTFDHNGTRNIFTMTGVQAWNKLYNTQFIRSNGIVFQETKNSNDQAFSIRVGICVQRYALVNKCFYVHRTETKTSVQQDKSKTGNLDNLISAFKLGHQHVQETKSEVLMRHYRGYVMSELGWLRRGKYTQESLERLNSTLGEIGCGGNEFQGMMRSLGSPNPPSPPTPTPKSANSRSIWNRFDKIVCVHYLPYVERFEHIKSELRRVGILDLPQFEFHYTVDNPLYGHVLKGMEKSRYDYGRIDESNIKYTIDSYNLLKKLQHFGYQHVLILEDDIVFHQNLNYIKEMVESTPSDYDVANYDCRHDSPIDYRVTRINQYWQKYKDESRVFNMSCCAISKKMIDHIIFNQNRYLQPFDIYTWRNTKGFNTYCNVLGKNLCVQDINRFTNRQGTIQFKTKYPTIDINDYKRKEVR